jgi:hypothetical protein
MAFDHSEQIVVYFNFAVPQIEDIGEEMDSFLLRYAATVSSSDLLTLVSATADTDGEFTFEEEIIVIPDDALCLPSWSYPDTFIHIHSNEDDEYVEYEDEEDY